MKVIDLRSDTITLPTEEMRRAMYDAEVGDDVFGEDPAVRALEEMAAGMLGKEAALFVPSGTMSNLVSILTHTRPGDEVIVGADSHIFWYEVGGASALGGVVLRTVPNEEDARLDPDAVSRAVRPANIHFPRTTLLCLENTHNRCGGAVLTAEYTAEIAALAHRHGLMVHLDGARIFNAAIALGVPVEKLAAPADSVGFCLSKGLSAPVGSLVCAREDFIGRARKWRKMLGGGMRQAGVIAAAGIVALRTTVDRLAEDHATARRLAEGLADIPGIRIDPARVRTNILIFESPETMSGPKFIRRLNERGVRMTNRGGRTVRAVTSRMVSAADIEEALARISAAVNAAG